MMAKTVSKTADIVCVVRYGFAILSSSQKKPLLKGSSAVSNTTNKTSNTIITTMFATKLKS